MKLTVNAWKKFTRLIKLENAVYSRGESQGEPAY